MVEHCRELHRGLLTVAQLIKKSFMALEGLQYLNSYVTDFRCRLGYWGGFVVRRKEQKVERELLNKAHRNFGYSSYSVRVIKPRGDNWAGPATCKGQMRPLRGILVTKSLGDLQIH